MVFYLATHWLGLAPVDHRWQAIEVIAPLVGLSIGIALLVVSWWLFPPVEFLDEGRPSRFRRFRTAFWSVVVTLVLGVAASAIYGAAS